MPFLNELINARIVICGAVSQYSGNLRGPSNYLKLAERNASMAGFVVNDHPTELDQGKEKLLGLYREGSLNIHEQIEDGIESFAPALAMLFNGGSVGKLLVRVKL